VLFRKKTETFGLALGGGAARGFAHIGVIKAFQDLGLTPDFVAGTSAGSIVGAAYCAGLSWQEIQKIAEDMNWQSVAQPVFPSKGLMSTEKLENLIDEILGGRTIEELQIPFCAVAVDIASGNEVRFRNGPTGCAVRASCGLPGIFVPVEIDDMVLVDGGVMSNIPVEAARDMGAELVVAVDLNEGAMTPGIPKNTFDVIFTSFMIMMDQHNDHSLASADVVIRPRIGRFSYHDMSNKSELMTEGEAAAREAVSVIRSRLRHR
jgi:NTE family protein